MRGFSSPRRDNRVRCMCRMKRHLQGTGTLKPRRHYNRSWRRWRRSWKGHTQLAAGVHSLQQRRCSAVSCDTLRHRGCCCRHERRVSELMAEASSQHAEIVALKGSSFPMQHQRRMHTLAYQSMAMLCQGGRHGQKRLFSWLSSALSMLRISLPRHRTA